jgi:glutathione peroxidase-family protein
MAVLALTVAGAPGVFAAEESQASTAVHKSAPDFALPDLKGATHKLSEDKGKVVVLEWFNDGCPFVKKHYHSGNMQKLQKAYTKKGVVWLTICSSAPGKQGNHSNQEFESILKNDDWSGTVFLIDADGKVGKQYGAKTTPHMFVIDSKGVLSYAGAIDDAPDTDEASIAKSKNYVKAALDELLSGKAVTMDSTRSYGCSVKYQ